MSHQRSPSSLVAWPAKPCCTPDQAQANRLERPQEVDDVLLLPSGQPIETADDLICLAIVAPVSFNSLHQIACPSVMEEKDALPDTPERSCSELIGTCGTLRDAVRKTSTHMVDEEV